MSYLYTKTEKIISELWEELEVANNDRENNFFASGGDSISLIRLSILIKERFGVDVEISELLQYPLLHEMANYIDSQIKTIIPECHKQIFNKDSVIPLSSSQRGIWYQMELDSEKENKHFNIPLVFRVLGRVDITRLNYSFKEIIKRHRVINSSISDTNGYPGIVLKENEIKISVIDVSELSNNEKEEKFSEIKIKEQNKVIDIKSAPLFFVSIMKYSEELYYMFITSHHMIFDGVSYDILLKELIEVYQGNQLEDLKLDYLDYVTWENSDEYQSYLEDGLTYWQLRLDSFRPMELPYKYITSSTEKDNSSLFFDLTAEQVSELNVLARKHNTTLYTVFVVALQIVLNEFKTTGDIAFGTYVSNRHLAEFNSVIGNFVNPLLLRFDYNEEHTISNALIATHEQITQDFIRQHIPFESIVKKMNPDRKKGEHSLFEFTFIYNNSIFEGKYENEYLSIESCNHQLEELETNRTDIEFWVRPNLKSGGFQCELNIQVNKVNKRFAKILLDSINHILINFIEQHSDTTLNELALFPSSYEYSELHSAAYEFNNYPLTQLIRDNASKSPNKIAIVDGDIEYSYAYLEEKSNCIARGLNELKSTPSPIIGVLLPYGIDLVISCLSILKCGGIIFLLDINESSERIESILDESECKFIITNSE
ncbi:condensation domain-containing protein [Providencia vermicola]